MAEVVFFICWVGVLYTYFGYPLLVTLAAWTRGNPVRKADIQPDVSVVVAAYNEEDVILRRVHNLLDQEYPSDKIEILIGSDGSTDRTGDILSGIQDPRVRVFVFPERRGKMAVLNDLVREARHDIVVFTDARQVFDSQAVRCLVRNFADPDVGGVTGELIILPGQSASAKGVGLYWRYEKWIRRQESRLFSVIGVTGAIAAFRKAFLDPLPEEIVLDDMFWPLKVIEKGRRVVFDPEAVAYDVVPEDPKEEWRRKVRTLAGNFQIFRLFPPFVCPWKGRVGWMLFSHKLMRLLVPEFLLGMLAANLWLLDSGFGRLFFAGQVGFYGLAAVAVLLKTKNFTGRPLLEKIWYIPYTFCLLNAAAFQATVMAGIKRGSVPWEKASFERRPGG